VRPYRDAVAQTTKARKERWFHRGVHAFNCLTEEHGDAYYCPICADPFTIDQIDDLSFEHAPPESVGGIAVALTCRSCNSHAGHAIDVHARRQKVVYDFMSGKAPGSAKVKVTHGGVPIRSTMNFGPGGILMIEAGPKANNPDDVQRSTDTAPNPGDSFTIQFEEPFDHRLAKLSWVRAAYLAAFAWFGYRYIGADVFTQLREQILRPAELVLPSLPIIGDPERYGDPAEHRLAIMSDPLDTVIVSMGWISVLLPADTGRLDFFDTLGDRLREVTGAGAEGARVALEGRVTNLPWPDYPRHVYDG
jgi:hypothetical protein